MFIISYLSTITSPFLQPIDEHTFEKHEFYVDRNSNRQTRKTIV